MAGASGAGFIRLWLFISSGHSRVHFGCRHRDGKFNRVPMIIGSNLHEGYFFASGSERTLGHPMTEAEYVAQMKTTFGPDADALMKQFPAKSAPSPATALGDAINETTN